MKKRDIQALIAIISLGVVTNVFSAFIPENILLKNGSGFDIVYKTMPASQNVYEHGKAIPRSFEENLIPNGTGKTISTRRKQPIELAIKRHGFGSTLSSWVDVPDPEALAKEQLNPNQMQDYYLAVSKGRLPIISVSTGYTGGWKFTIGYMK